MLTDEIHDEITRHFAKAAAESSVINASQISDDIAARHGLDQASKKVIQAKLIELASSKNYAVELNRAEADAARVQTGGSIPAEQSPTASSERR